MEGISFWNNNKNQISKKLKTVFALNFHFLHIILTHLKVLPNKMKKKTQHVSQTHVRNQLSTLIVEVNGQTHFVIEHIAPGYDTNDLSLV